MNLLDRIEFGEQPSMEEIPTFSPDQLPQALNACAVYGIAKVKGLVSELSRRRLHKQVSFTNENVFPAEVLLPKVIDLLPLYELMNTYENIADGMKTVFGPVEVRAADPEQSSIGHIDTTSPTGITALSHIWGPDALFVASSHIFEITDEVFMEKLAKPAQFFDEYGAGDALFLRQEITVLNGRAAGLPAMIHDGLADKPRELLALDFRSNKIWLPELV